MCPSPTIRARRSLVALRAARIVVRVVMNTGYHRYFSMQEISTCLQRFGLGAAKRIFRGPQPDLAQPATVRISFDLCGPVDQILLFRREPRGDRLVCFFLGGKFLPSGSTHTDEAISNSDAIQPPRGRLVK